jgi:hypothetical protein
VLTRAVRPTASKHRLQARQACTAVVSGLAVFAALQLGLAAGIEYGFGQVRDPLYGSRLLRIERRLHAAPLKPWIVVMLGSSRTQWGFRMGDSAKAAWNEVDGRPVAAFNFGVAGGGPLTQLLLWKRLLRDGVRPDLLLVEVTAHLLDGRVSPQDFSALRLPVNQLYRRDLPLIERYAGTDRGGVRRDWLLSWPVPWYAHRFNLVSLVKPSLLPGEWRQDLYLNVDDSGAPAFVEFAGDPEQKRLVTLRELQKLQHSLGGYRLGGPACTALCELLTSCRQEGVPVLLVVMPEGPAMRGIYPEETWSLFQQYLHELSARYNAPIVNARDWADEEDFLDSHHLLANGAAKFTERLGRQWVLPWLHGLADRQTIPR